MKYVIIVEMELTTEEDSEDVIEQRLRYLLGRGISLGDKVEVVNIEITEINE